MLMLPETFPEQPPRAAAGDRVADAFARNNPQFRRGTIRQAMPIGDETTEHQTLALLPHAHEIAVLSEARGAAQPPASGLRRLASGVWGRGGHERKLNRRQTFASHATAIGKRGFAILARIAVEKSVLPFPTDFRWLILAFHKSSLIRAFCAGKLRLTERRG